jgi:hypothetical protein
MRRFIDIVSESATPHGPYVGAIPADIVDKILGDHRVKRGVKIPPSARLWRGESKDTGSGMASYGLGTYFTCDRKYAAKYGTVREIPRSMLPYNCLRFDTINDYEIWYQTAFKLLGYNDNREVWKDYTGLDEFIRDIDMNIDGLQIGKGKDAMFVLYP